MKENVEVRYPFEPEPKGKDAENRKPVRVRIGAAFYRGARVPADGGVGMLKGMLIGAGVLFVIAVIAAIADGISRLN